MSSRTAQERAKKLGVPLSIPITNNIRQAGCDAQFAELVGIRGDEVRYRGECYCGHLYDIRMTLQEARNMLSIDVNGEIVVGQGKGFKAENLEEY